jgi:hypothetical protein
MKSKNAIFVLVAACTVKLLASDDLKAVHEWGTFTSVAGDDGAATAWQTLSARQICRASSTTSISEIGKRPISAQSAWKRPFSTSIL